VPISHIMFLLKQGYSLGAIHDQYSHVAINMLSKVIDEIMDIVSKSPDVSSISHVQAAS
jgi:hypothetical protein